MTVLSYFRITECPMKLSTLICCLSYVGEHQCCVIVAQSASVDAYKYAWNMFCSSQFDFYHVVLPACSASFFNASTGDVLNVSSVRASAVCQCDQEMYPGQDCCPNLRMCSPLDRWGLGTDPTIHKDDGPTFYT